MEISKALKIFNLDDVTKEDEDTLKRRYKKLSKKYHPDNYKDDGKRFREISEAYSELIELIKQVKLLALLDRQVEEKIIQITLEDLIQIYKEGSTIGVSGEKVTKADLHRHRVLVIFSVLLRYDNEEHTFSSVNLWNIEDRYEIQVESFEKDVTQEKEFSIGILGNNRDIHLKSQKIQYITKLDFNIKVGIVITRKVISNN